MPDYHDYDAVLRADADAIDALAADNARLRSELRAAAGMLAVARTTRDRAERQKLMEMAEARARDAGETDNQRSKGDG